MIKQITDNKRDYMRLLLLADEQESMIDKYLDRGEMFALIDDNVIAVCVVTQEDGEVCELKNIAVYPEHQGQGYGKQLIDFISGYYSSHYSVMLVGTGDSPGILSFYRKCGFKESHRVKSFFTDNYDHPIFECGEQLVDMIYLSKNLH
ncbi:MAG: GNAT family N-acetyltransferase [Eubacteriales bacterium]